MNKRFRLNTTRLILRNFKKSDNFNNYFEMIRKQSKNNLAVDHSATQKKDIFFKIKNYEGILMAIFLKDKKHNIGTIGISAINNKNLSCNIGILLHDNFLGKGYAYESMARAIDYCHLKLNINIIYLFVKKNNLDAIKLYEKLGFLISKKKKIYPERVKLKNQRIFYIKKKQSK